MKLEWTPQTNWNSVSWSLLFAFPPYLSVTEAGEDSAAVEEDEAAAEDEDASKPEAAANEEEEAEEEDEEATKEEEEDAEEAEVVEVDPEPAKPAKATRGMIYSVKTMAKLSLSRLSPAL